MSTDSDNAAIVRNYVEQVWNEGRTELADKFLTADLIQHNPNLPDGRQPLVDFIAGLKKQLPDSRFDIVRVIADDDHVVTHSVFTADGQSGKQAVVDIFRLADGLIVEHWDLHQDIPDKSANGHDFV